MRSTIGVILTLAVLTGCTELTGPDTGDLAAPSLTSASSATVEQASVIDYWAAGQQSGDIVDIASAVNAATGEFSILIEAVSRVGLVDALKADRQLTVLAPTDAAFVDLLGFLGATSLDDIDDATLTSVLLYHVVPGRRFANSVLRASQLNTLNGTKIKVKRGSATLIDANGRESNIVTEEGFFDIPATNGVIHVIDAVILP